MQIRVALSSLDAEVTQGAHAMRRAEAAVRWTDAVQYGLRRQGSGCLLPGVLRRTQAAGNPGPLRRQCQRVRHRCTTQHVHFARSLGHVAL